jgi:hypothetical protein
MGRCFWGTDFQTGDRVIVMNRCSNLISQDKAGSRKKKIALIEALNPEWKDLYEELDK